jgi:guanine deaminase
MEVGSPSMVIIEGDYINPLSDKSTKLVRDGALVIEESTAGGRLIDCGPRDLVWRRLSRKAEVAQVIDRRGMMLAPGFVDVHFHWVQDDVRLMPKDSLLEWLSKYTWPYEAKFKSVDHSKKRAQKFSSELLQAGTLAGLVYGSIHDHSVDDALNYFQGEFACGNVLMTMNSPANLLQTPVQALKAVRSLGKKWRTRYALTPRFAPTTHPEVMRKGMSIAREFDCMVQTHLSESLNEIDYVLELYRQIKGFEDVSSYTEIYDRVGLLTPKTVLGHAIHLSPAEWKLLKKRGSAIACCPSSNAPVKEGGLGSGVFNYLEANRYKVPWALASDIGGGPYLSMLDVMHSFIRQQKRARREASFALAHHRATRAGAKIMGVDKQVGTLDRGSMASFIVLPGGSRSTRSALDAELYWRRLLNKKGSQRADYDHLVLETYVDGKLAFSQIGQ